MRETIKPGSLSKRAAALGLKPRRTHDCSQGLNLDPRDSATPSLSPAQSDNQGLQDALRSLSLSIMVERGRHTNWTPEQPVWKAGGVNPDVTPVRSVPPHAPRWEEQQQQWSQFSGAWAWWATSGGHREGWCTRGLPEGGR